MKRILGVMGVLAAFGAPPAWAQSTDDCVPSTLNIPEAKYPCVYPDRRALFRVVAPDAQKVRLRMGPGFDMTKGPDGIWSVTTTPLVVGFHYYSIQVDGAVIADPSTHTYFGSGWQNSAIEVPAADAGFYEQKDVPHGRVSQQFYHSKVTGKWRRASSTRRPTTTPLPERAIPSCICCTAGERTKPGGTGRDTWT